MAYIRCGGGGVPASLKTDMNAVLNKKFETSTTYPPNTWADTVNLMGVLPIRSAQGSIAHFSDGADLVPFKSAKFYITPQQASGTPTPSNPLPITGWTGANVNNSPLTPVDNKISFLPIQEGTGDPSLTNVRPIQAPLTITRDDESTLTVFGGSLNIETRELAIEWKEYTGSWTHYASSNSYKAYRSTLTDRSKTSTNALCNKISEYGSFSSASMTKNIIQLPVNSVANFYMALDENEDSSTIQLVYEVYTAEVIQLSATEFARALTALGAVTYPVSWSEHGTIYGGYFKDGELWATYKLADLSIMDWDSGAPNQDGYIRFVNHSAWGDKANGYRLFCDKFPVKTSLIPSSPTTIGVSGYSSNANIYIAVESSMLTGDLSTNAGRNTAFRDWISDNGLQILYELATPVKVADLDPLELVSFLGVNNVWCDSGDCEVEYRADIDLIISQLGG